MRDLVSFDGAVHEHAPPYIHVGVVRAGVVLVELAQDFRFVEIALGQRDVVFDVFALGIALLLVGQAVPMQRLPEPVGRGGAVPGMAVGALAGIETPGKLSRRVIDGGNDGHEAPDVQGRAKSLSAIQAVDYARLHVLADAAVLVVGGVEVASPVHVVPVGGESPKRLPPLVGEDRHRQTRLGRQHGADVVFDRIDIKVLLARHHGVAPACARIPGQQVHRSHGATTRAPSGAPMEPWYDCAAAGRSQAPVAEAHPMQQVLAHAPYGFSYNPLRNPSAWPWIVGGIVVGSVATAGILLYSKRARAAQLVSKLPTTPLPAPVTPPAVVKPDTPGSKQLPLVRTTVQINSSGSPDFELAAPSSLVSLGSGELTVLAPADVLVSFPAGPHEFTNLQLGPGAQVVAGAPSADGKMPRDVVLRLSAPSPEGTAAATLTVRYGDVKDGPTSATSWATLRIFAA